MPALPLLLLVACRDTGGGPEGGDTGCSEEAVASVLVHVTDPAGEPRVPDGVTWSLDGGPPQAAERE